MEGMTTVKDEIRILAGTGTGTDAADYFRMFSPLSCCMFRFPGIEVKFGRVSVGDADRYDVLWLQQHSSAIIELVVRAFQARGKPVIYDVDDMLVDLPPSWPAHSRYFGEASGLPVERLEFHKRLVRMADLVTCPTAALAEALAEAEEYNVDRDRIRVLPNCVMAGDWDTLLPAANNIEGPVVGWFGTATHWDDWREIIPAVDQAIDEVGGSLVILGYPGIVHALPDRLRKRTYIQPLVRIRNFPSMRRAIRTFDLGLAWCTGDLAANRLRSPLKAIQYGAAGVPTIASQTVYGEDLPGWGSPGLNEKFMLHDYGLTVTDPATLAGAITWALGEGHEAMQERAGNWQRRVWNHHTYEVHAPAWLEVAREAMERCNP